MTGSHPCISLLDCMNWVQDPQRRANLVTSQCMVPVTAFKQPYFPWQYSRIAAECCARDILLVKFVVIQVSPILSPASESGRGVSMV